MQIRRPFSIEFVPSFQVRTWLRNQTRFLNHFDKKWRYGFENFNLPTLKIWGWKPIKLLHSVALTLGAAEWVQPTYWDAMASVRERSGDWGFPVGIRSAADWSLCPTLATPTGASGVVCNGSTCMVQCLEGYQASGRRRVRCRWKQKHGFFWRNQLSGCQTCEPADPATLTGTG